MCAELLKKNHLDGQSSPYLLQHVFNPVDWYPWGEEALAKARTEDKLILLSIGYSACHWCHVMAHESFEDPDIAALMNERYVNIKVDREERPDLDKIYQLAHQVLMRRGGGWPLTVILMPDDHLPIFAGTYFPPQSRMGMPSFTHVLNSVADFYQKRRQDLKDQNESFRKFFQHLDESAQRHDGDLSVSLLDQARYQLEKEFDGLYGGFGEAPKFPHPTNIERLVRHWELSRRLGNEDLIARDMAWTNLKCMALGGIYDQLGGGFCRYSVDQEWMIPHFEKMLYDNGPLLSLYSYAALAANEKSDKRLCRRIAAETADWAIREMQAENGGFYSALDADSDGAEGKYYVWHPEQIQAQLDSDQFALFAERFGLNQRANFEGLWHLYVHKSIADLAKNFGIKMKDVVLQLNEARGVLFRERDLRVKPGRDEKQLTSWNALMIKGLAQAGRMLHRPDFVRAAQAALDFIRQSLIVDGELLACNTHGKASLKAYLDDYAFLLDALLELLQSQWRKQDYELAVQLAERMIAEYLDIKRGGFYFTGNSHEKLIQRSKQYSDEAIPAGNGIAAFALQRLAHLNGNAEYFKIAESTLRVAWQAMEQMPQAHNALLHVLEEWHYPPHVVILSGPSALLEEWREIASAQPRLNRMTFSISEKEQIPESLSAYSVDDAVKAYICKSGVCELPITDLEAFRAWCETDGRQSVASQSQNEYANSFNYKNYEMDNSET